MYYVRLFYNLICMGKAQLIIFIIAATISTLSLLSGVVYFVWMYKKRQLETDKEFIRLQEQFAAGLMENTIATQQETMQYIGREIHDNVGQKLTLASLYVQQQLMQESANTERLSDIGKFIDESLRDLRLLSKALNHHTHTAANFASVLSATCEAVNKIGKCKVEYEFEDLGLVIADTHRQVLLRVLQEFLQNSVRHAQCSIIYVTCKYSNNQVQLLLQDNGIGFSMTATPKGGSGLLNIQARVASIGGTATFSSKHGDGTSLLVTVDI